MNGATVLKTYRISLTSSAIGQIPIRSSQVLVAALNRSLRDECNGSAHCVRTEKGLEIEIQADTEDRLKTWLDSYLEGYRRQGLALNLAFRELPAPTMTAKDRALAEMLAYQPVKLSRRYFFSLADGVYLASNVYAGPGPGPSFAEPVASSDQREAQWLRIRECGAAQRLCRVFPSEGHFRQWHSELFQSLFAP